jgi:peptide chain release factor 2
MAQLTHENIPAQLDEIEQRVAALRDSLRYDERREQLKALEAEMGAPDFWDDPDAANATVAELKKAKAITDPVAALLEQAEEADDAESRAEVDQSLPRIRAAIAKVEKLSLLSGKYDDRNCYLSIYSREGGTEADDWCEMLMRMYLRYFERSGFDVKEVALNHGNEAGLKDVTLFVKAPMAFGYLSCERGTHRLARVSPFNSQGKRQTSFCAVDVIPEFPDTGGPEVDEQYLDTQVFARSSGPGGQNVNKVATAVRLVYQTPDMPEPIMIVCSAERKLEQNKKQAMSILRGKLELIDEQKRQAEMDSATGGSLDMGWGTQIRSYVFYDNRVKDHRTNFEIGNPQTVLDGELQGFIDAELQRRAKARQAADAG